MKNVYFLPPHEKEVLQIYNYGEGDLEEFSLVEEQENGESFVLMTGEMMDGVLEGYCQIFEPDKGLVFEGNWSNNMRCGTCVEYDYECVSFQGNYRNDKRNGYGWEYDQDELQREGVWIDGVYQQAYRIVWEENFVGVGLGMHITLTDNDTHITTVRWEDGKCNGRALTYSKNENRVIQERVYMHGDDIDVVPISQPAARRGVLKFPNGSTWEGDISLDAACGEALPRRHVPQPAFWPRHELPPERPAGVRGPVERGRAYGGRAVVHGARRGGEGGRVGGRRVRGARAGRAQRN